MAPKENGAPAGATQDDPDRTKLNAAKPIEPSLAAQANSFGPASISNQRSPDAVGEARLGLIRVDIYGDLDEIRIFAEQGLRALEVGNDLDLGRAFDQSVKHFRAVAANLKALVLATTGRAP